MSGPAQVELAVELELALDWRALPGEPSAAEHAQAAHELLVTLRALDALQAAEGRDGAHALARVEAKLDLLLLLLGRAASAASEDCLETASRLRRLTPTSLRLTPGTLAWQVDRTPPAIGSPVEIDVLLLPGAPVAARLPARIHSIDTGADIAASDGTWVTAQFTGLDEEARDALAARVFRIHRQAIQARRGP